jgi:hypothetical protein
MVELRRKNFITNISKYYYYNYTFSNECSLGQPISPTHPNGCKWMAGFGKELTRRIQNLHPSTNQQQGNYTVQAHYYKKRLDSVARYKKASSVRPRPRCSTNETRHPKLTKISDQPWSSISNCTEICLPARKDVHLTWNTKQLRFTNINFTNSLTLLVSTLFHISSIQNIGSILE